MAALISLLLVAHGTDAAHLTRDPSIWLRTSESVVVSWQTNVPTAGTVLYGPTPGNADFSINYSGMAIDHAVELQGLDPATSYYYRVASDPDSFTSDEARFRTAPVTQEPFRFLAFGDLGRATPEQIEVAARVDSLNADLAILTGDIIYEFGEAENFTPQYFDIYHRTIARIPFYPSLGNHDVVTANGQPYLDAFELPSNSPAAERYYSFDYSNAHFVCLEVVAKDTPPGAAMLSWLDQDLASTKQRWKFVFFHIPMYSNGGAHGADATIAAAVEPILNAHGVDVVFQGHNHYYTRTFPLFGGAVVAQAQDPDYLNPGGTIYIVTGGGGRFLHDLGISPTYEAFSKSTFHVTSVDVYGDTLTLRAIERDGTVIDSMRLAKATPVAVALEEFRASSDPNGVRLTWKVSRESDLTSFHVYRGYTPSDPGTRLTAEPVTGSLELTYVDATAEPGRTYYYSLGAIHARGGEEERIGLVAGSRASPRFAMERVRPNPSEGEAEIRFTLDRRSRVSVGLYDVGGRQIRSLDPPATLDPGSNVVAWDGKDRSGRPAPAGLYLVEIRSEGRSVRSKVLHMR